MRAVVARRYGPPEKLEVARVARPKVAAGRVLVRVVAAGLNAGDWHLAAADPAIVRLFFGLRRPRQPIFGSDLAGVVEAVGERVTDLAVGDAVVAHSSGFGAFAEWASVPADEVVRRPAGLDAVSAAAVGTAALTAWQGLRDALRLRAGERVLIAGAGGGVGRYAVALATHLGAEVTAVTSRPADGFGAAVTMLDHAELPASGESDAVFVTFRRHPLRRYLKLLRRGGRCVLVGGNGYGFAAVPLWMPWARVKGRRLLPPFLQRPSRADLAELLALAAAGTIPARANRVIVLDEVGAALAEMRSTGGRGKTVARVAV
jgi:NADPH:quinone reductase-like Zn-dependent oxidoreductase